MVDTTRLRSKTVQHVKRLGVPDLPQLVIDRAAYDYTPLTVSRSFYFHEQNNIAIMRQSITS